MKAHTHDEFHEFSNAARRLMVGMGAFIGLFGGLLFLLRDLTTWVLNVLNALH